MCNKTGHNSYNTTQSIDKTCTKKYGRQLNRRRLQKKGIILFNWKGRRAADPITDCTGDRHIGKPHCSNDGEVANPTTPKFQSLSV